MKSAAGSVRLRYEGAGPKSRFCRPARPLDVRATAFAGRRGGLRGRPVGRFTPGAKRCARHPPARIDQPDVHREDRAHDPEDREDDEDCDDRSEHFRSPPWRPTAAACALRDARRKTFLRFSPQRSAARRAGRPVGRLEEGIGAVSRRWTRVRGSAPPAEAEPVTASATRAAATVRTTGVCRGLPRPAVRGARSPPVSRRRLDRTGARRAQRPRGARTAGPGRSRRDGPGGAGRAPS